MRYLYYLNGFGIFTMVSTWGVGSPKASQVLVGGDLKTK
jgi:hypothetical protein